MTDDPAEREARELFPGWNHAAWPELIERVAATLRARDAEIARLTAKLDLENDLHLGERAAARARIAELRDEAKTEREARSAAELALARKGVEKAALARRVEALEGALRDLADLDGPCIRNVGCGHTLCERIRAAKAVVCGGIASS